MTTSQPHRIALPTRLVNKFVEFRRARLRHYGIAWVSRTGLTIALVFCAMLVCDRVFDTPVWLRIGLLGAVGLVIVAALIAMLMVGLGMRTPLRTAKLIRRHDPVFGDHLVGGLELADSSSEQVRSEALCVAALGQVADEADKHDFTAALPPSRARGMLVFSGVIATLLIALSLLVPAMVRSSLTRLLDPFGATPRFTFVDLSELESIWVVPRDEESRRRIDLTPQSRWVPAEATITMASQVIRAAADSVGETASGNARSYTFRLPPFFDETTATLRVGDERRKIELIPKSRPQLTDLAATVVLPEYLGHVEGSDGLDTEIDRREVKVIEGGLVTLNATATSRLRSASANGKPLEVKGDRFSVAVAAEDQQVELNWIDDDGLRATEPFPLRIRRVADEAPLLMVEGDAIPARVLESESLRFSIDARDDFAVRRVGMEWNMEAERGDRVLGKGSRQVLLSALFQATAMGVPVGEVVLRFWAEDDFPGRQRVYSDPITLNVLSKNDHAVWIAQQFARWRQAAMDVRDRELNLFSRNRDLAQIAPKQRDASWRSAVAEQARAEAFNARQLDTLTDEGQQLLRQAARNEEVDVEYLEQLGETIKTLEQMANDGMPRIAKLLEEIAEDEESAFSEMIDQESTQTKLTEGQRESKESDEESESNEAAPERIGLAGTDIVDTSKRKQDEAEENADSLSIAIEDQTELVAEFDAVAEELAALLGNMEGSTLVKRLKSVSRQHDRVAMSLNRVVEDTFGRSRETTNEWTTPIAAEVVDSAAKVRTVLDDLEAFCQRREIEHFEAVLNEMKSADVLQGLKRLQGQVVRRPGLSIASAEYWADTLDRWADDLVDPGSEQPQSGPQNSQSLPPAFIVEVLRVLEGEVDLREQTRVAEQGRTTMAADNYMGEAVRLSESQELLRDRLDQVVDKISALPNAELNFSGEMEVLSAASAAMVDATKVLVSPETGPPAIAAETEAIELLLRSRKVSPEGGGGGGGNAGGGKGGQTDEAAIALLGASLNELARTRESETELSVGGERREVPERWRVGLDAYFERLEQRKLGQADGEGQ